jgi:hypothetical protein
LDLGADPTEHHNFGFLFHFMLLAKIRAVF